MTNAAATGRTCSGAQAEKKIVINALNVLKESMKIILERRKGTLQALTRVDKLNRSQVNRADLQFFLQDFDF